MAALTKNQSKGLSEAEVLNQCTAYLTARGIYHWRQNTGAFKVENRFIRTGMKGVSDILGVLPGGRLLAIEVKREKGGKLSAAQKEFIASINSRNGCAIVVHSLAELIERLERFF